MCWSAAGSGGSGGGRRPPYARTLVVGRPCCPPRRDPARPPRPARAGRRRPGSSRRRLILCTARGGGGAGERAGSSPRADPGSRGSARLTGPSHPPTRVRGRARRVQDPFRARRLGLSLHVVATQPWQTTLWTALDVPRAARDARLFRPRWFALDLPLGALGR